jgi:hypothetical protein
MWQEIKMRVVTQNLNDRWQGIQKTANYVVGEFGIYVHNNTVTRKTYLCGVNLSFFEGC